MKKYFLPMVLLGFCAMVIPVQAQMTLADDTSVLPEKKVSPEPGERSDAGRYFVFRVRESLPEHSDAEGVYGSHFLGDTVARKMHVVKSLYLKKSSVTVGFGNTHVEIIKPYIFNSLTKLERYYKKAVRKEQLQAEDAAEEFALFLDHAVAIFYSTESAAFEEVLARAKDSEELISLFESVRIEKD